MLTKIAILASGSGSNAEEIVKYFNDHTSIRVAVILTNNPNSGVIYRAKRLNVPCRVFAKSDLENASLLNTIQQLNIDFMVLAGFLLKIPGDLIKAFPDRIINLHPALLPAYGGKGMYGHHVHEAVLRAGEKETGITIHLVNEEYDKGRILFQKSIPVNPNESADELAQRIHAMEHAFFPKVIEDYITSRYIRRPADTRSDT